MNKFNKRQKLSKDERNTSLKLLSDVAVTNRNFVLEINANSRFNLNREHTLSWVNYDLTNREFNLYGSWMVGIKSCFVSNSINSWKNRGTELKISLEENTLILSY